MTTEEQKLVERLREGTTIRLSETAATYTPPPKLQIEAADTITRLVEERDGLSSTSNGWKQAYEGEKQRGDAWMADAKAAEARATALEAKVAELQEALKQYERLLTINAVRAVAAEHAPLWLEAADAATDRVRAK